MRLTPVTALLALGVGLLATPAAHAEVIYGTGTYTVPVQLAYGVYVAHADPNLYTIGCTFSTWTRDGKLISSDGVDDQEPRTASISAPAVAKFITHGCTPWTRVG